MIVTLVDSALAIRTRVILQCIVGIDDEDKYEDDEEVELGEGDQRWRV